MKAILTIGAVVVAGYALWVGAKGLDIAMGMAVALVFGLLAFANFEQIAKFKASPQGIEVEARDLVNKAQATLAQLQELAALMGKIQVSLLVNQGRIGGYPKIEQEKHRKDILVLLEKIGVSKDLQDEVLRDVWRLTKYDYVCKVLWLEDCAEKLSPDQIEEWRAFKRSDNPPDAEELRLYFKRIGMWSEVKEEWLKDYDYYCKTRQHRRPSVWFEEEE